MDLLSTIGILVLTCVILTLLWMKKRSNYWKNKGVSTVSHSIIWGNMKDAIFQSNSLCERVVYYYQTFKSRGLKYGGIYFMWDPMFVPLDLGIIKSIMQTDFQHFVDRGIYYDEKNDPLSAHLFSLAGKKWKLLRHKLSPTFTSGKMKMMFDTLVDCTGGLYKVLDKDLDNAVDIKDVLGRFTTDIIGNCAFGIDCNSLENPDSEFRAKGKRLFHRTLWENMSAFSTFMLPQISKIFKRKITPQEVNDFFLGVVRDNVAYREKNNIFRKDFMHLLIQLKNRGKLVDDEKLSVENISEEENKITLLEIAAQAFIFFEAGFETSSTTMTFCLYELAKQKNIQEKLRGEIKKVFAKHNNQLTYEAVMDMPYLEQTINETLRKYPPLVSLSRICTKEYQVPGTDLVLEEGVRVMIPVYGIHHDPDYYPDPEKFDPDRFSEENKQNIPPFAFIPFGEGPRICIGARFGKMQTKVGLIALLLNYEFTVNEKTQEPLQYDPQSFTLSTKGDIWLNIKKVSERIDLMTLKDIN
ncbi:hypothetical protein WA026_009046 [Henosepilachna vigintioctopunctata]|uniref:Cytochrome P450 n=1 Tax=Henosepilachna vigintioctopunctata TaxID=420089 RepID=A0AAW1UZ20_9CUCU